MISFDFILSESAEAETIIVNVTSEIINNRFTDCSVSKFRVTNINITDGRKAKIDIILCTDCTNMTIANVIKDNLPTHADNAILIVDPATTKITVDIVPAKYTDEAQIPETTTTTTFFVADVDIPSVSSNIWPWIVAGVVIAVICVCLIFLWTVMYTKYKKKLNESKDNLEKVVSSSSNVKDLSKLPPPADHTSDVFAQDMNSDEDDEPDHEPDNTGTGSATAPQDPRDQDISRISSRISSHPKSISEYTTRHY